MTENNDKLLIDFTSMGYVLFHAGISAVLCFRRIATGIGYTS